MDIDQHIDTAKNAILKIAEPRKIILFGSAARGDSTDTSDIDLLVIIRDGIEARQIDRRIRRSLISPEVSYDLIVMTESEFSKGVKEGWRIFKEILREGKTLYAA